MSADPLNVSVYALNAACYPIKLREPLNTSSQTLYRSRHPLNALPRVLYVSADPLNVSVYALYAACYPLKPYPRALYVSSQALYRTRHLLNTQSQPL
ncbi:hypothetical protein [Sporosarcina sp. P19]|uniref:hypothetical protein n=1 Tax=Sporosarcina sp. P19 TaxID=2048258 RepID=UPI00117A3D0B|nr:hypothetical protein [Sporosarcina sp. P19]